MADRLRVPSAKPPARHRMPTRWQWGQVHRYNTEPSQTEPQYNVGRRLLASINVLVAAAAGGALLNALVGGEYSPADSATLSDNQRHAYVTKRYTKCKITNVLTGATGSGGGRKLRVDWQLQPDPTVNEIMQRYADSPRTVFGPAVPVIRMFNIDSDGRPILSREIARDTIDTEGRYNPDHFYAQLPLPQGYVRYALSVRNSVTTYSADGTYQTVYGEQQCAELRWRKPPGGSTYRWEYAPPPSALAVLDRYAVTSPSASPAKGDS